MGTWVESRKTKKAFGNSVSEKASGGTTVLHVGQTGKDFSLVVRRLRNSWLGKKRVSTEGWVKQHAKPE